MPYISELLRDTDCPAVEDCNDFAEALEDIWQKDGMLLTYAAVLEAEKPETLHRACDLLQDLDNYQRITEDSARCIRTCRYTRRGLLNAQKEKDCPPPAF